MLFRSFETELYSYAFLVQPASYPNLKYLTYGSYVKDAILQYAARQLNAITSAPNLTHVTFDLGLDHRHKPDESQCKILDSRLAGDRFPSLQSVMLHRTIPFGLFPKLHVAGKLLTLNESAWPWVEPPTREYV